MAHALALKSMVEVFKKYHQGLHETMKPSREKQTQPVMA